MNVRAPLFLFIIFSLKALTTNLIAQGIQYTPNSSLYAEALEGNLLPIDLKKTVLTGLEFLFMEQYEDALDNFNHVLNALHSKGKLSEPLFGSALWGRLLCHAYSNQEQKAFNDLSLIRLWFIDSPCYFCKEFIYANSSVSNDSNHRIFQIADFANPNEKISSAECKQRVKGTASVMRLLVMKIPNRMLADAIQFTISELEHAALQCCERSHWTECLDPVVDSWSYLKKCMDKGSAIAPNLATPGR